MTSECPNYLCMTPRVLIGLSKNFGKIPVYFKILFKEHPGDELARLYIKKYGKIKGYVPVNSAESLFFFAPYKFLFE